MSKYEPMDVRDVLCSFVETWFSPGGRGNSDGCWNVQSSCALLSHLFTAQGVEHRIVSGVCNGVGHSWIVAAGSIFDPSCKKFGDIGSNRLTYTITGEQGMPSVGNIRSFIVDSSEYTASYDLAGILRITVLPKNESGDSIELIVPEGKKFVDVLSSLVNRRERDFPSVNISNFLNAVFPIANRINVINADSALRVSVHMNNGYVIDTRIPVDYLRTCTNCGQQENINFLLFSYLVDKFYEDNFPEKDRTVYLNRLTKHSDVAGRIVEMYGA